MKNLFLFSSNYTATLDEEKKNAIRKLDAENQELKIENENLKKKVREFEKIGQ